MEKKMSCFKPAGTDSEESVFKKLIEWYGESNCIRLQEYLYIVKENECYYLMAKTIPEIYFTYNAIKLNKLIDIHEESDNSIIAHIKKDAGCIEMLMTSKPKFAKRVEQLA